MRVAVVLALAAVLAGCGSRRYRDYKADKCPTDSGSTPPPTAS
jgi:hypothetical protein